MRPIAIRVAYRHLSAMGSGPFDLKKFKSIYLSLEDVDSDYTDLYLKEKYLDDHAKFIASGKARSVYDLGNGTVLKLAQSQFHKRDNLAEIKASGCLKGSKVIAKVLDYDPDGTWLIMEKVTTFQSEDEFKPVLEKALQLPNKLKFRPEETTDTLWNLNDGTTKISDLAPYKLWEPRWNFIQTYPSAWWKNIQTAIKTCGLLTDDLISDNFGLADKRLVILDYGS